MQAPNPTFKLTAMAAGLAAAFSGSPAMGQDDEVRALTRPQSEVSLGAGIVDKDNQRFGQYTGLNEKGGYLLLDADLVRRDDATGTWLRFGARDAGLDSRELRFEHNRQGDWGYFIDFSQIPRFNPYDVRTGLQGIGSATQTAVVVAPGAGALHQLDTRRDRLSLGVDKALGQAWGLQLRVRSEQKEGSRLFGQGVFGNVRFLTDPIDYTTHQLDAVATYTGERLQLSGGYYGTDFSNSNLALNVNNGVAGLSPMALPPGNQSHQLHLAGGYNITPTTRGMFKVAYARQTQTDQFPIAPTTVARSNLDGRVDTKSLQLGVTTRPLPKLSLLANLRYEDRDDRTPIEPYLITGVTATSTFDGTNEPRSVKTLANKLEASYALPAGMRATAGIDYEQKKRNQFRVRSVSNREETDEITLRGELRRSLGETLTGAVSFAHSERDGSPFLFNVLNGGAPGSNKIAPLHLADRERDKLGLSLGWTPTDPLSLQLRASLAKDDYASRSAENLGLRAGEATLISADAAYQISEAWQATAFATLAENEIDQAACEGSPAAGTPCTTPIWAANLRNVSRALGVGANGRPLGNLRIGTEIAVFRFRDSFGLTVTPTGGPLPDINTRLTTLKLFAEYALSKVSGLRAHLVHDRYRSDDWTWANWTYTDGTRVNEDPDQKVNFVGLSYYYQFR